MIRLLLADDHNLFRQGLRQICEIKGGFQVLGEAADGLETVRLFQELKPDVTLIDINMPRLNGIQATQRILEIDPHARVIILTMHRQDHFVFEAIKAGAKGFLLKTADAQELIVGIEQVQRGEALISPKVAARMMDEFRRLSQLNDQKASAEQLTDGEMDVLRLVGEGAENQDIASQLNLSEQTVANRLRTIYQKINVNNRTQAVLYALRHGWVRIDPENGE